MTGRDVNKILWGDRKKKKDFFLHYPLRHRLFSILSRQLLTTENLLSFLISSTPIHPPKLFHRPRPWFWSFVYYFWLHSSLTVFEVWNQFLGQIISWEYPKNSEFEFSWAVQYWMTWLSTADWWKYLRAISISIMNVYVCTYSYYIYTHTNTKSYVLSFPN